MEESKTKKKQVEIGYGLFHDSIPDQLTKQGLKFDPKKAEAFECCRQAAIDLLLNNFISDSVWDSIIKKIQKKLSTHCKQQNKAA